MARVDLYNVSVEYPVYHQRSRTIARAVKLPLVGGVIKQDKEITICALNDISLALRDGDRLALLGRNGAGKTTLLKTIASIYPPTAGRIRVEGRISALTSLRLGLDGESTGYENIRIRARFMGYSEDQIEEALPGIVEFTELHDYLNMPLKTYSSGMRMRLTFATSTAFKPEVLVLDEWVSAGDHEFKAKATKRLRQLIDKSGIFIFASHSRDLQKRVANKGAVLGNGQLLFYGDLADAIEFQEKNRSDKKAG